MTDQGETRPEQLERFLSNREGDSSVEPAELQPRHLVAIAMTTDDGLDTLDDEFDWDRLLRTLAELDEDEQSRWLRRLIRNLGTRTASGIESEEGVSALSDRSYQLRHQNPEVFITFLDEIQSLLRHDTSSSGISGAEDEFRRLAEIGDRESDERVASFREQDLEQRLVEPTLNAESRISLLETLAQEPIEDVPTRMVVDALYPLRNHHDAGVEQAALEAFENWAKQLEQETATEAIEILERDLANEIDELPTSLITGIIMSGYIGPAIVEWLVDLPRIESRQDVVVAAFDTLEHIPGLRDSVELICDFLLRDAHEDEAVYAGIDVLESVLVGLEPHQNTENPVHTDHIQGVFFTQEELSVDEKIRSTLQTIVESSSYSEEVRAHAASAWLSVRPPEIQQLLWDIDIQEVGESAVVDAKLEAAADHRLVEFVDVIEDLWQEAEADGVKRNRLVESLDQLESREIVDVLLDPAFDSADAELRQAARETLVDSGYESEIERESQRRTIIDRISARFDAMSTAADIDRDIRDRNEKQTSTEEQRKQAGVKAAEAASKSVDNLAEFRSQGATQMLKLAPLFDQLKDLEAKIRNLVGQIDTLCEEIRSERDEAQQIEQEIKDVESDIDSTEQKLEDAKQQKEEVEDRINELDHEIIPDLENDIRSKQREYKKLDSKEPKLREFSGEDRRERYEQKYNQWENEMQKLDDHIDELESKKSRAETEMSDLKSDLSTIGSDISQFQGDLKTLRGEHQGLASDLDNSIQRIDGYQQRLENRRSELNELLEEYERIQSQVDDIVGTLNGIRESARSRESELQSRSEKFRSRVGSLRQTLQSLAETQSDAIDRRERQARRVRELANQLDIDHDDLEHLGERTKEEVPEADREAVELADQTRKRQYQQNETTWRLDSIFRRTFEADRIEDADTELAERAEERVKEGEAR